jgi:hypothetical protein
MAMDNRFPEALSTEAAVESQLCIDEGGTWAELLRMGSSTIMSRLQLNSVGYTIAVCRWTNVTGGNAPLSTWVPDQSPS